MIGLLGKLLNIIIFIMTGFQQIQEFIQQNREHISQKTTKRTETYNIQCLIGPKQKLA